MDSASATRPTYSTGTTSTTITSSTATTSTTSSATTTSSGENSAPESALLKLFSAMGLPPSSIDTPEKRAGIAFAAIKASAIKPMIGIADDAMHSTDRGFTDAALAYCSIWVMDFQATAAKAGDSKKASNVSSGQQWTSSDIAIYEDAMNEIEKLRFGTRPSATASTAIGSTATTSTTTSTTSSTAS